MKGRKILIGVVFILLIIDIIATAVNSSIYAVNGELSAASFNLLQGIFRFILTVLILYFFYNGYIWAKRLITILLISGGLFALFFSEFYFLTLFFIVVYFGIGLVINFSNSVNDFLAYQKDKRVIR